MPTSPVHTYGTDKLQVAMWPENAKEIRVTLPDSVSYAKGTILGELTASAGVFAEYDSGNADGSDVPRVVLPYAVSVDASGNHTIGGGERGETELSCPAYAVGVFRKSELPNYEADVLTHLGWREISDDIIGLGT